MTELHSKLQELEKGMDRLTLTIGVTEEGAAAIPTLVEANFSRYVGHAEVDWVARRLMDELKRIGDEADRLHTLARAIAEESSKQLAEPTVPAS